MDIKTFVIMDYEQKYNAALLRARKIHSETEFDYEKGMMEEIFPELAESEDEKMRKMCVRYLDSGYQRHSSADDRKNIEKCISWLEKQGEKNVNHIGIKEKAHQIAWETSKDYDPLLSKESWCEMAALDMASWLEEQGEQKPYGQRKKCSDCQFNYTGECKGSCQMKIDEQKSSDKAEPKFHEGEWIVSNDGTYTYQVREVKRGVYILWDSLSNRICITDIDGAERSSRLWTIQDAKDGDVLATSAGAFIYNGNNGGSRCPGSYCDINTLGRFQTGTETHWTGKEVYPATKEQRDLLFCKMKEAGYEWDSDKKELKKIEPKTLDADKVIEFLNHKACIRKIRELTSPIHA